MTKVNHQALKPETSHQPLCWFDKEKARGFPGRFFFVCCGCSRGINSRLELCMAENSPKYRHPQHSDTNGNGSAGIFDVAQSSFWAVLAIVVFAFAFGGGGSKYGLANLIVQLAALIALALHRRAFFDFWRSAPTTLRVLIGLSIALPIAFIIPLPFGVWSSLPGRELMVQSYELLGENGWASASVDPVRTLLALTALIAPLALLSIGWRTPRERLILIGWVLVGIGVANFALGIPQVLTNSETGVLYPENPMPGVLFGTFANRNSTGLFLVGALTFAAFLPMLPKFIRADMPIRIGVCILLVVAILLTRSRTALVLAMIPLSLAALRIVAARLGAGSAHSQSGGRKGWMALVPVALLVTVFAGTLIAAPGRVNDVVERFDSAGDARSYIWDDATYSAGRYWPIGSGMGTFDDVFQVDESLENMTVRKAGRAHNDYLEVAIEAGLPGLLLVSAWLIVLIILSWSARTSHDRWIAWSGSIILFAIALQSITDYPLRNMSILTFSGFALLILVRFGVQTSQDQQQEVLP